MKATFTVDNPAEKDKVVKLQVCYLLAKAVEKCAENCIYMI